MMMNSCDSFKQMIKIIFNEMIFAIKIHFKELKSIAMVLNSINDGGKSTNHNKMKKSIM